MKSKNLLIISAIIFIILLSSVQAIGISPPRVTVDFEPNLQKTYTFTLYNSNDYETDVELYIGGSDNLREYATLDKEKITLSPSGSGTFTCKISLPKNATPGTHDIRVGAAELPPASGSAVVARAAVEAQLWIRVPYEGKIADVSISAKPHAEEEVELIVKVKNPMEEQIDSASAIIGIFNSDGDQVWSTLTESVSIGDMDEKKLYAYWNYSVFGPGVYYAVAEVTYDGNVKAAEASFEINESLQLAAGGEAPQPSQNDSRSFFMSREFFLVLIIAASVIMAFFLVYKLEKQKYAPIHSSY